MPNSGKNRVKNSLRNTTFNSSAHVLSIICNFIVRTIFIRTLSADHLGINGLFTNIISIISLAELGIGSAIAFRLYKPLAQDDEVEIKKLLSFYRKAYSLISLFVLVFGLFLLPFLGEITKISPGIQENIYVIYMLYIIDCSVSYLLIYKKTLIIADQKEYITSTVNALYTVLVSILQIMALIRFHSFLSYLIVRICATILQNIANSLICDRMYPYVKNNTSRLEKDKARSLFHDVKALVLYKISGVVVKSTDNLIISHFVGLTATGLYSNYYLITHSIYALIGKALTALTASIGNLNTTGSVIQKELVYRSINFAAAMTYGICCAIFVTILDPFIEFWVGANYIFSKGVSLIIIVNFYVLGISQVHNIFRNAFGLFIQGKYRPVVTAITNLAFSLISVRFFGIHGVLGSTTISILIFQIWYDPYIVHVHALKKSPASFLFRSLIYALVAIAVSFLTYYVSTFLPDSNNIFTIILKAILSGVIGVTIYISLFHRTKEFRHIYNSVIKNLLKRRKNL